MHWVCPLIETWIRAYSSHGVVLLEGLYLNHMVFSWEDLIVITSLLCLPWTIMIKFLILLNSFHLFLFHVFGVDWWSSSLITWLCWVQILDSTEQAVEHSLASTGRANVRAMKIYSESSKTSCFTWLAIFAMICIFIMVVLLIRVTWSASCFNTVQLYARHCSV